MSSSLKRSLIILHITVFVWGLTGILGALITIDEVSLVWYRVLIATLSLGMYFIITKHSLALNINGILKLCGTGLLLGLHWILFFGAIKASNISVTMVCLSSLTLFTAFTEPILNRKKISKLEIMIGLVIIYGIYLIFKFESKYTLGIILGLSSAFVASIFTIINGKQIKNRSALTISFYELFGAFIGITIYLLFKNQGTLPAFPSNSDLMYLLILGTLCTSVAYVFGVAVMKDLSAFRVALITNLEPIYSIIMALIIFGETEHMSVQFYLGAVIILLAIFSFPVFHRISEKRKSAKIIF